MIKNLEITAGLEIRKAGLADIAELQKTGRQTFIETFAHLNTEEDMQKYLEESFSEEKLSSELRTKNSEFYLAILDKRTIAYLKINLGQAQNELKEYNALEIERIYVLSEFQGKRVGQALYEKAITIARENKTDFVWLGVWEKNQKALKFYRKNGFAEFDRHIFKLGNDEQTDIMMKLPIKH